MDRKKGDKRKIPGIIIPYEKATNDNSGFCYDPNSYQKEEKKKESKVEKIHSHNVTWDSTHKKVKTVVARFGGWDYCTKD